jgi:hypothetical protein
MSKIITSAGKKAAPDKNKERRERLIHLAAELRNAKSDEAAADALEAVLVLGGAE